MKRMIPLVISLALLAVLAAGCSRPQSQADEPETKVPVEVMTVQLGRVVQTLNYTGDIEAEYQVKVFSKIPDRIAEFFVDEGDYVSQGAPIARIVATTIEEGVRQAEAGLAAAKAQHANLRVEYERAQRLSRENAMSKQQYDGIQTQYEATKAQVEQAEAALRSVRSQFGDATVTAPISGIIGKRYYEAGDMASPAMPLVSIVKMNRVKAVFNVTEEDLGKIEVGQKAEVSVKSYPDRTFPGKVARISPILDPVTRMAEVQVQMDNPGRKLKPGMYGHVEVTTGLIDNVIVVPRHATIENTSLENNNGEDRVVRNYYVFVVDSSVAERRKLDVIYVNHERLAVTGGVEIGEQLVTTGQNNLRDGSSVLIADKKEDQTP